MIIIDNNPKVTRTPDIYLRLTPTEDNKGADGTGVKLVINGETVMFMYEDSDIIIYESALRRATGLDVHIRSSS